jgi:uncharacterized membrane protein
MQTLYSYLIIFITMALIDGVWLTVMNKTFYRPQLGHLLSKNIDWLAAGLFYPLYVFGILFFVVSPALKNNTALLSVFITGAVLGLVAYGTYDLTNQATLKNWPALVTAVDLVWGALITGTVSVVTVWVIKSFF